MTHTQSQQGHMRGAPLAPAPVVVVVPLPRARAARRAHGAPTNLLLQAHLALVLDVPLLQLGRELLVEGMLVVVEVERHEVVYVNPEG